jgi:hypothetical protein
MELVQEALTAPISYLTNTLKMPPWGTSEIAERGDHEI